VCFENSKCGGKTFAACMLNTKQCTREHKDMACFKSMDASKQRPLLFLDNTVINVQVNKVCLSV